MKINLWKKNETVNSEEIKVDEMIKIVKAIIQKEEEINRVGNDLEKILKCDRFVITGEYDEYVDLYKYSKRSERIQLIGTSDLFKVLVESKTKMIDELNLEIRQLKNKLQKENPTEVELT